MVTKQITKFRGKTIRIGIDNVKFIAKYGPIPATMIINEAGKQYYKPNGENDFVKELEESILAEGVIAPLLVRIDDINGDTIITCDQWGGSRLYVAQKHNLTVNCIIIQYSAGQIFSNYELIKNNEHLLELLVVKPKDIFLTALGLKIGTVI